MLSTASCGAMVMMMVMVMVMAGESSPLSMTEEQTLACIAKADYRYCMRMMHVTPLRLAGHCSFPCAAARQIWQGDKERPLQRCIIELILNQ